MHGAHTRSASRTTALMVTRDGYYTVRKLLIQFLEDEAYPQGRGARRGPNTEVEGIRMMKIDVRRVTRVRFTTRSAALLTGAACLWSATAAAEDGPVASVAATAQPVAPSPSTAPPAPYSLPWQLRPVAAATVLRLDTSFATYTDPATHNDGTTVASMFLASYKVTPNLAPLFRIGFVQNSPGPAAVDATGKAIKATYPTVAGNATSNPLVGLIYGRKANAFKFAGFLAATIPIGGGGGPPTPTMPGIAGAESQGVWARSAMDNAMFAVNYFAAIGGLDGAYVASKLTVQAEATLFQLFRTRGDNNLTASNDKTRTNSTFGIHAGYFVLPILSLGAELRYQRWLSTPTTGAKNTMTGVVTSTSFADYKMDSTTAAIGPRFHFKLGKNMWCRPGISYARGLDRPITDASYNMVQVDVPVVF